MNNNAFQQIFFIDGKQNAYELLTKRKPFRVKYGHIIIIIMLQDMWKATVLG